MAKTHHRSIRTAARYTRPGLAAVSAATEHLEPFSARQLAQMASVSAARLMTRRGTPLRSAQFAWSRDPGWMKPEVRVVTAAAGPAIA